MNFSAAGGEIVGMILQSFCEDLFERWLQGARKGHDPVFGSFAVIDHDGPLAEIDVLDPKPEGFHQTEPGPIH